jgi:pyruvate dehydrogenase E1 component alpha subunit
MAPVKSLDLPRAGRDLVETPDHQAELARKFLHFMFLMREVEERIERKLYRQGKIVGGVYVGRGQEAICVGAGLAAGPDDVLFPCHRDLGLFFIRGVHPRQVLAQYMGRVGGLSRGKDGNMHMGDLRLRIVAIISAMAASVPVAAGAALALKYRGSRDLAMVFFGDGATSRGDWHEGINLAAVQKLPLVLICNNNAYAYSTPLHKQMACEHVADRGAGYGIPAEIVDGNIWDDRWFSWMPRWIIRWERPEASTNRLFSQSSSMSPRPAFTRMTDMACSPSSQPPGPGPGPSRLVLV